MDRAFDALFKQCGVIRADTIDEMFDIALALANLPLPQGNRAAIITNAGGPGIMAADACESAGLQVVELQESTQKKLKAKLVADASVGNPVDLLAGGQPEDFKFALEQVLTDEKVDAAIVIFVALIIINPTEVALKTSAAAQEFDKPVLGCFMGVQGVAPGIAELHRRRIPAYPFPESAARALASMMRYSNWLKKDPGATPSFPVDKDRAKAIVQSAITQQRAFLNVDEVSELLTSYGIACVKYRRRKGLAEIIQAAHELTFPLVLKAASSEIVHKSEIGGVKLNLQNVNEVERAYHEMLDSLKSKGIALEGVSFILQEMLAGGREAIMGLHAAQGFGTLIMFGLGGIHVEVLQDVAFRLAPLSSLDAEAMLSEIKGYPILKGIRGEPPVDLELAKEVLLRLSLLTQDFPEIQEMDINPFMLFPQRNKCAAVDARIRLHLDK